MSKVAIRRSVKEAIEHARKFEVAIQGWEFDKFEVCGSVRREKPEVGDIDILIVVKDASQREVLNSRLMKLFGPLKTKPFRASRTGMFDGWKMNCMDVLPHEYGAALLMHTGSSEFNVKMRSLAKSKGYKLNQYGLFDQVTEEPVCEAFTEEAIFNMLGEKWVHPRHRQLENLQEFLLPVKMEAITSAQTEQVKEEVK